MYADKLKTTALTRNRLNKITINQEMIQRIKHRKPKAVLHGRVILLRLKGLSRMQINVH